MASGTYNADSITVLEGLEAVRKRPGMYIGGVDKSGLHHLLWEVVDNSVDEVMNGHASKITVALHADGKTMTVADNGRGIPVDIHPKSGLSALEVIFTKLHAGGKFDKRRLQGGRRAARRRGERGERAEQVAGCGGPAGRDHVYAEVSPREAGRPGLARRPGAGDGDDDHVHSSDPEIFGDQKYDADLIRERLEVKTYLNKGLSINFADEKAKEIRRIPPRRRRRRLPGGGEQGPGRPEGRRLAVRVLERDDDDLRIDLAICWTEATDEDVRSYVNTIPTRDGGTHEQGLRKAVGVAVSEVHGDARPDQRRGVEIKEEDIREGLVAVLSVCVREPQFQGQTKDRSEQTSRSGRWSSRR